MGRLTWKKVPPPNGLARIGCGPQGSELRMDGKGKVLARTSTIGGDWRRQMRGWYWYGQGQNTCNIPAKTEAEAKAQAVAYIKKHGKAEE